MFLWVARVGIYSEAGMRPPNPFEEGTVSLYNENPKPQTLYVV